VHVVLKFIHLEQTSYVPTLSFHRRILLLVNPKRWHWWHHLPFSMQFKNSTICSNMNPIQWRVAVTFGTVVRGMGRWALHPVHSLVYCPPISVKYINHNTAQQWFLVAGIHVPMKKLKFKPWIHISSQPTSTLCVSTTLLPSFITGFRSHTLLLPHF